MQTKGKTALITGASGGIGLELSRLFAAEGFDLVLVARNEDKLKALAADLARSCGIEVTVLAKDLSDPAGPEEIWSALQERSIQIDVLVNNAGYGTYGAFAERDLDEDMNMLQLNLVTLTHLTGLFLPGMVERGYGRILNVGSTGSFQPTPLMAVYGASKAYVLSFSEALAEELRGSGVQVTALCPGVTRTGFQARARVGRMRLVSGQAMTAQRVAEIGYRALMRGRALVVPGLVNLLMSFSSRLFPRFLVRRVAHYLALPHGE